MAQARSNALQGVGCSAAVVAAIVNQQGFQHLDDFVDMDDDDVEALCKVIRRPGGALAAQNITFWAETNLKLATFYLRHLKKTSRPLRWQSITVAAIRSLRTLKEDEEAYTNPTDKPTINDKDWSKMLKNIEEYLATVLGETKIPLSYVIRTDPEVTPHPADGPNNYDTPQEEMVARAPHRVPTAGQDFADWPYNPVYQVDNWTVWILLKGLTVDLPCFTYLKPFQRRKDGRGAYYALYNQFLGPNNANNTASKAESKINALRYLGDRQRFTFETYTRLLKEQFHILNNLAARDGHAAIDAASQVRKLMNGIKTSKLDIIKSQILASPALQTNLDACINLYNDFMYQSLQSDPKFNISAVQKGRKADDDLPGKPVEDRYYTHKEFYALTPRQRTRLTAMRQARGHPGKSKKRKIADQADKSSKGDSNKFAKKFDRKLAAISKQIAALKSDDAEDAKEKKQDSEDDGGPN